MGWKIKEMLTNFAFLRIRKSRKTAIAAASKPAKNPAANKEQSNE